MFTDPFQNQLADFVNGTSSGSPREPEERLEWIQALQRNYRQDHRLTPESRERMLQRLEQLEQQLELLERNHPT